MGGMELIALGGELLGGKGADAAKQAGQQQRGFQQQGLDYLMQADELPQELRSGSLGQLGALFGVTGGQQEQAAAIEALRGTPIYQAIMGSKAGGEEALLRQASATGGLRGGNVQEALYDYNVQLENQALMQGLQGLQGLSNVRTNEGNIANMYGGIGQTAAQQTIGEAQSKMAGQQMALDTVLGVGGLGLNAASVFSDRRLKDNVIHMGKMGRFNVYSWKWNDIARELGLTGPGIGVMVDEVEKVVPEAIGEQMGYKTVNYAMIGA